MISRQLVISCHLNVNKSLKREKIFICEEWHYKKRSIILISDFLCSRRKGGMTTDFFSLLSEQCKTIFHHDFKKMILNITTCKFELFWSFQKKCHQQINFMNDIDIWYWHHLRHRPFIFCGCRWYICFFSQNKLFFSSSF